MSEPVALFGASGLSFSVVDATEDAAAASLVLTCAAVADEGLLGLRFALGQLAGQFVVHPAALLSVGEPTQMLVRCLARAWGLDAGPAVVDELRLTAHALRRPTPSRQGLRFTLKDLRWETAVFKCICSRPVPRRAPDNFDPYLVELEVELDVDGCRLQLSLPAQQRQHFLHYLTGVQTSAQPSSTTWRP